MHLGRIIFLSGSTLVFLIAAAFLQTGTGLAADDSLRELGIRSGLLRYQFKDLTLNPTRYDNQMPGSPLVELSYSRTSPASQFRVRFGFGLVDQLSNRFDDGTWSWAMHPNLDMTYLKKCRELSTGCTWYLGADLQTGTHFAEIPLWDDTHYYWLSHHSLNLRNLVRLDLAEGRLLRIELAIPLIALVSRPPEHYDYLGDDTFSFSLVNRNLAFTSLHEYRMLEFSMDYSFPIHSRLDVVLGCRADYFHCRISGSRDVSIVQQQIAIGINYGL